MIRTLIVDDSMLFRKRLKTFLADSREIVIDGEAADGESALQQARTLKPDLVLMDIKMEGMNGLSATEQLKQEFPDLAVIILSQYDLEPYRKAAEAAGASAYVAKRALVHALMPAIHKVMEGIHDESGSEHAEQHNDE